MDHGHFDDLTRSAVRDGGTRRAVLRLLAGGAFGSLVARLGLSETTEAKPKRHKSKPKPKRTPQAERKAQGQLQAEGKRKGKKGQGKKKPKPPQPPCSLDKFRCPDERTCPDDSCAGSGECCPTEQKCADGECYPWDDCCPGRKRCYGNCIPDDACCHADPFPLCGQCEAVFCDNGSYACRRRSDLKECPDGSCVTPDACCPGDEPQCGFCEVPACEDGQAVCKTITQECPGGEWDTEHCRCKYCEETCDPDTLMCHSTCPEGHRCEEGKCRRNCDSPIRPQLCCVEEFPGQVRCACRWINEICYASGGIAACVPGQTCCDPDAVRSGMCPQECLEAEICRD
jgi:hypothetical protein